MILRVAVEELCRTIKQRQLHQPSISGRKSSKHHPESKAPSSRTYLPTPTTIRHRAGALSSSWCAGPPVQKASVGFRCARRRDGKLLLPALKLGFRTAPPEEELVQRCSTGRAMAMSNLYSKIAANPYKRFQDNSIAVTQTNAWVNGKPTIIRRAAGGVVLFFFLLLLLLPARAPRSSRRRSAGGRCTLSILSGRCDHPGFRGCRGVCLR